MDFIRNWFVPGSVALSRVVDGAAVMAGDFRVDSNGRMRMAMFVSPGTGANRVNRIVQRLTEIETYKSMSMLGLVDGAGHLGRDERGRDRLGNWSAAWAARSTAPT
jgi:uncharacterized membrane-anchored protein